MVLSGDRAERGEDRRERKHACTEIRVEPHPLQLSLGELSWLVPDGVRDSEAPDVVYEPGSAECRHVVSWQPVGERGRRGEIRHTGRFIGLAGVWNYAMESRTPADIPFKEALKATFTNSGSRALLPSVVLFAIAFELLQGVIPFYAHAVLPEDSWLSSTTTAAGRMLAARPPTSARRTSSSRRRPRLLRCSSLCSVYLATRGRTRSGSGSPAR